jgi:hypothetical protein
MVQCRAVNNFSFDSVGIFTVHATTVLPDILEAIEIISPHCTLTTLSYFRGTGSQALKKQGNQDYEEGTPDGYRR